MKGVGGEKESAGQGQFRARAARGTNDGRGRRGTSRRLTMTHAQVVQLVIFYTGHILYEGQTTTEEDEELRKTHGTGFGDSCLLLPTHKDTQRGREK